MHNLPFFLILYVDKNLINPNFFTLLKQNLLLIHLLLPFLASLSHFFKGKPQSFYQLLFIKESNSELFNFLFLIQVMLIMIVVFIFFHLFLYLVKISFFIECYYQKVFLFALVILQYFRFLLMQAKASIYRIFLRIGYMFLVFIYSFVPQNSHMLILGQFGNLFLIFVVYMVLFFGLLKIILILIG